MVLIITMPLQITIDSYTIYAECMEYLALFSDVYVLQILMNALKIQMVVLRFVQTLMVVTHVLVILDMN